MEWIELGYLGLFFGTFLAATILPFSSEFILTGLLIAGYDPWICFLVATSGNTLGSTVTYGMGRMIEYEKALRKLKIKEKNIKKSHHFFQKYGIWIALFAWVPILGDAGTFLLGSNKTNFFKTMLLVLVGKALRFAIVIYLFLMLS
ncbi:MAG: DedA family protein [Crocinitomicaceae bacterium]|nr:DedA family protein [Crocinitomicaceae bacterium]